MLQISNIQKQYSSSVNIYKVKCFQIVAECLENSGIPKEEYSTLGVYVGLMAVEYQDAVEPQITVLPMLGVSVAVIAGRLVFFRSS